MLNGPVRMLRALPVVPVALLAGCGVAGTQFNPGLAARVGDETITTRHVDQVTDDYCTALGTLNEGAQQQGPQEAPYRYMAHEFANALVNQAAAEQLAEEYDVTPTDAYHEDVESIEPIISRLPEDQQDAVREVYSAGVYTDDVLTQIGEQVLADEGQEDATAEDQRAAGLERLQEWADDNDVEVNPRYGIEFGTFPQVDTDLSYAASDDAKRALSEELDPAYTSSLPERLVCTY